MRSRASICDMDTMLWSMVRRRARRLPQLLVTFSTARSRPSSRNSAIVITEKPTNRPRIPPMSLTKLKLCKRRHQGNIDTATLRVMIQLRCDSQCCSYSVFMGTINCSYVVQFAITINFMLIQYIAVQNQNGTA